MGRTKGTTTYDYDLVERRAKRPTNDFPTKAECAAMKAPPKKHRLAKARIPMSSANERIVLTGPDGYLMCTCTGFTRCKEQAYFGTELQVENLIKRYPEYADLKRVPYRAVFGVGASKFKETNS